MHAPDAEVPAMLLDVREIDDDEGWRLLRIIRRGTESVVTWRRAQMVLLSAQGMPVAKVQGRAAQDVHAAGASRDQEDRQVQAG
jgi:hypothetical protein